MGHRSFVSQVKFDIYTMDYLAQAKQAWEQELLEEEDAKPTSTIDVSAM